MILDSGLSTAPNGVVNWNEIYNTDFTILDARLKSILIDVLQNGEDLHMKFSTDDGNSFVSFSNSSGSEVAKIDSTGKISVNEIKINNSVHIVALSQNATLSDVINKVNDLILTLENLGILNGSD